MARGGIAERFKGPFDERITRYQDGSYQGIQCDWYTKCPITYRCEAKHEGHDRCKKCKVKAAYHSTKEKNLLIRK
ncbi:MAG: hypothetical protein ACOCRK_05440 [bacterium]